MALLQAEGLAKSFGILELFANLSFSIERGQKVGLIAPNGAGKSTLLNVLVGKEPSDAGSIVTEKGTHIAYLPQKSHFQGYPTIYAACLSGIRPELRHAITAYEQALQSNAPKHSAKLCYKWTPSRRGR